MASEPEPTFTYADWAALLGRGAAADSLGAEWQSIDDLCTAYHAPEETIRKKLRSYKQQGRLESRRVSRESIDGVMRTVPVYRVKAQ